MTAPLRSLPTLHDEVECSACGGSGVDGFHLDGRHPGRDDVIECGECCGAGTVPDAPVLVLAVDNTDLPF